MRNAHVRAFLIGRQLGAALRAAQQGSQSAQPVDRCGHNGSCFDETEKKNPIETSYYPYRVLFEHNVAGAAQALMKFLYYNFFARPLNLADACILRFGTMIDLRPDVQSQNMKRYSYVVAEVLFLTKPQKCNKQWRKKCEATPWVNVY